MSDFETRVESEDWKRTIYILCFAQLITAIGFSIISPFLPLYVESLGSAWSIDTELLAGLVFSVQAMTMMIASPIWGVLADKHGRKIMVERSMFGGALILGLMAFVRNGEELVLLRGIQGLVTGTISAASALAAAAAPRHRTGYAMGLLFTSMNLGIALGPFIGGPLADAFGQRSVFFLTALLLFIAGVLVTFGVRESFSIAPRKAATPQWFVYSWRHVLRTPGVKTTYGVRFLYELGRMIIYPIAPLFIISLQLDTTRASTYTGLLFGGYAASSTISALCIGRLGDRIGHRLIVVVSLLIAALLYIPQYFVQSAWQLIMLQTFLGVSLGGVIPAITSLLAGYTEVGEEGVTYGLDNSINAAARALGPMIGSGMALWFGLRSSFLAAGIIFLVTSTVAARFLPHHKTISPQPRG